MKSVFCQRWLQVLCYVGISVWLTNCRGWTSESPPLAINMNMVSQPKYKPFRESKWFADKRDMRPLAEGVVPRGYAKLDEHFYRGMVDGKPATSFPANVVIDKQFMLRGQDQFNVHCSMCHAKSGDGLGLVGKHLPVKPTDLHVDYLLKSPVGHFYDVITHGIRTMPAYGHQIPEMDRWAITAYVRALQLSQNPDATWLNK